MKVNSGSIRTNGSPMPQPHVVRDDTTGAAVQSLTIPSPEPAQHDASTPSFYHGGPTGSSTTAVIVPDDMTPLALAPQVPASTCHQNLQLSHAVTFDADESLAVAPTGAAAAANGILQFAMISATMRDQLCSMGLSVSDEFACSLAMKRLQFVEGEHRQDCRQQRTEELKERLRGEERDRQNRLRHEEQDRQDRLRREEQAHQERLRREEQDRQERHRREDRDTAERRHQDVMEGATKEKDWRAKVEKAQEQSFTRIATWTFVSLGALLIVVAYYRGIQLLENVTLWFPYTFIADKCSRGAPVAHATPAGGNSWEGYFLGSVGVSVSQYMMDAFTDLSCVLTTFLMGGIVLVGLLFFLWVPAIPSLIKVAVLGVWLIHQVTAWRAYVACHFLYWFVCCAYTWWIGRNFKDRHQAATPTAQDLNGVFASIESAVITACSLPPFFLTAISVIMAFVAQRTEG